MCITLLVVLLISIGLFRYKSKSISVCAGKIQNEEYMMNIPVRYHFKGEEIVKQLIDKTDDEQYLGYTYAYINSDSVPELIVGTGGTHVDGMKLYAYIDNEYIFVADLNVPGYLRYRPYKNTIQSDFGGQGFFQLAFTSLDGKHNYTYTDSLMSDSGMANYPDTKYYHNAGEEIFSYLGIDMPSGKDYTPIPISESEYEELYSALMGDSSEIVYLDYSDMMKIN